MDSTGGRMGWRAVRCQAVRNLAKVKMQSESLPASTYINKNTFGLRLRTVLGIGLTLVMCIGGAQAEVVYLKRSEAYGFILGQQIAQGAQQIQDAQQYTA